jgi:hypothetical protein
LGKPLSKRIKHEFSRYELGQRALVTLGQASHNITSRLTIWSAGYRVRSITPLEPEKALKEGAELVGESVVFCISGGWILYEYNRGQTKTRETTEAKRQQAKQERQDLRTQLHAIDVRLQALEDAVGQAKWTVNYREPSIKGQVKIAPAEGEPAIVAKGTTTDQGEQQQPQQQQQLLEGNSAPLEDNGTAGGRQWWRLW